MHAHDWQAGLVPVLLARMFRTHTSLRRLPTVFTIHNLAYQGIFDASWLPHLGLGWDLMRDGRDGVLGPHQLSQGRHRLQPVDHDVSPRYAQEIQTRSSASASTASCASASHDLVGILNGIDYDQWDPERDPNLPEPYSADHLRGKGRPSGRCSSGTVCRHDAEELARPVVGLISRMVDQKGFDLLATLPTSCRGWARRSCCSDTGERRYEDLWLGAGGALSGA